MVKIVYLFFCFVSDNHLLLGSNQIKHSDKRKTDTQHKQLTKSVHCFSNHCSPEKAISQLWLFRVAFELYALPTVSTVILVKLVVLNFQ